MDIARRIKVKLFHFLEFIFIARHQHVFAQDNLKNLARAYEETLQLQLPGDRETRYKLLGTPRAASCRRCLRIRCGPG